MDLRQKQRFALSTFFFLSGFGFASWASRIPTIKTQFDFNEAELGTLLICMPISSLMGLPLSSWLVSKFDSRQPMIVSQILMALALLGFGFAPNSLGLVASMSLLAFSMRILNISINTQAVTLQRKFDKKVTGSFHGLWSTGGIAGIAICTLFVALGISMYIHLLVVTILIIAIALYFYPFLISGDRSTSGNKLMLSKPDPYIVYLGMIVFLASICEGGMFDWSGIFFKEVVKEELFTLGYLIFMICMSISRFSSDWIVERLGIKSTFIITSSLIVIGITLAVSMPYFWTSLLGFCLVGFGAAPVIPITYMLAGNSKKYSAGLGISIVATYGIVGAFVGPPLIGYIAHALELRLAFVTFAIAGLVMIPISRLFFNHLRAKEV